MDSLRKWFYKPRRDDTSLLAQFFYADEALNLVAGELDSFDGRKDPERCTALVNHLRQCQDRVLTICNKIMDELIPHERANRDFRVKFPDDVMHDNLAGQLWFGAECLAAGSSIMNRERESSAMRPLAKALTKSLENVRNLLREASLRTHVVLHPSDLAYDRLVESLKVFDRLLAEFELSYVSAMVPVKSVHEYELQQYVIVLFSETLQSALKRGLLTQDMVDNCDPSLMFTIPRLAIVAGFLTYRFGPLTLDSSPQWMSEMFRPFSALLIKIRQLLLTLSDNEVLALEKLLCSTDDTVPLKSKSDGNVSEERFEWATDGSDCETVMEKLTEASSALSNSNEQTINCVPINNKSSTCIKHNKQYHYKESRNDLNKKEKNKNIPTVAASNENSKRISQNQTSISSNSMEVEVECSNISDVKSFALCPSNINICNEELFNGETNNSSSVINGSYTEEETVLNDDEEEDRNSLGFVEPGYLSLNGQWTLPTISCACSQIAILSDGTMTKQGLINRGLPKDNNFVFDNISSSSTCEECSKNCDSLDHSTTSLDEVRKLPIDDTDVRWSTDTDEFNKDLKWSEETNGWPKDTIVPNEDVRWHQKSFEKSISDDSIPSTSSFKDKPLKKNDSDRKCDHIAVNSVRDTSDVILMPDKSMYSDRDTTESTEGLHVRYSENWKALCTNGQTLSESEDLCEAEKNVISDIVHSRCSYSCVKCQSKYLPMPYLCSCTNSQTTSDSGSLTSETSSFNSDCQDEEEIAMAIQAIEAASRNEVREKFSDDELVHRLFVCISGVADQLQTNFAGDFRHVLKSVFLINAVEETVISKENEISNDVCENGEEALVWGGRSTEPAPLWLPDESTPVCMSCHTVFTVIRRRHHCRNCGKVFCSRCSSNSVPLPRYGHMKPVRVCNHCFIYQITPFPFDQIAANAS
uniref:Lateral signaling target protein 2 homolog n=1 Tax=Clastoptera arizonana TaxID=38151 RepID=A0A1B6D072_9HEMI